MSTKVSKHYDESYFDWQAEMGEFGGWANLTKFQDHVEEAHTVLDFGCGGGYLLKNLKCGRKIGVEINPSALETARKNGSEGFSSLDEVEDGIVDVAISDNCLEHTLRPLDELKSILLKLKPRGKAVFVVPCESISNHYRPGDINHHLYSWSPMAIGNLFSEAGFQVLESRPYVHKWPRKYQLIAKVLGRRGFEVACRIYGRLDRKWFQVRVVARKPG